MSGMEIVGLVYILPAILANIALRISFSDDKEKLGKNGLFLGTVVPIGNIIVATIFWVGIIVYVLYVSVTAYYND